LRGRLIYGPLQPSLRPLDTVLVLDFGGQYAHLIARRIRELKVYSEIAPPDLTPEGFEELKRRLDVKGLVLSGGPSSVYEPSSPKCHPFIFKLGLPILGICYGHQLIAYMLGGRVAKLDVAEYGVAEAFIDRPVGPLEGLGPVERVWMSHRDSVVDPPPGFEVLAHTESCRVAAMGDLKRGLYGLQWHPEVIHTARGEAMLRNFVFKVCSCRAEWRMEGFVERAVEEIKEAVGEGRAVLALSGGVDSSTAAALASKALGDRFTAVFVDHGFMREGEPESIVESFRRLGVKLVAVDARERFLKALRGVVDPEEKRRVIGELFIRVFEEEARRLGAEYLIQGTIYPDRIESGFRRHSEKIKTHHNVAGLPSKMEFKGIVEPLRDLYKDEVREVAKQLGLPDEIVYRQPFPGPGLAVRVVGEVTREKVEVARRADRIVREEVERAGLAKSLWQYFAVLTDTKSTGVKGDSRAYGYTVAIRAVESREAMTASFAKLPYDLLERISTRITNEVPEVTRVVYDVTNKPPATIEWE
jgi:GMP synthase (glutamine-hydrolysing)